MRTLCISSLKELEHFARTLKNSPLRVFVLRGELGAGKTALVRCFAKGFRLHQEVSSPTFALLNVYEGSGIRIHHFDLYRLSGPEEAEEWGFSELAGAADYNFIEWGDRAYGLIPKPHLTIHMEHGLKENERILSLETIAP